MILGAGTVALDTVETPAGSAVDVPGGSALYFAAGAVSYGAPTHVAVVGVTGDDFPQEPLDRLAHLGVDVSGIRRLPLPTFRWRARYDRGGRREILSAHGAGIEREVPVVPPRLRDPAVLFLGGADPAAQAAVLDGAGAPRVVLLDSMPHWIRDRRREVAALLRRTDVFLANEEEVRLLGGSDDEGRAAATVRALGPTWVVVKRGPRGACAHGPDGRVETAGAPAAGVVDPTGAGDAFAGGLAAALGAELLSPRAPRAGVPAAAGLSASAVLHALEAGARAGARAVSAFSFEGLSQGAR